MLLKNDTRLLPWQKSAEGREKVRLIHLFDELLVKSPESGLLSDWLYNKKKKTISQILIGYLAWGVISGRDDCCGRAVDVESY